MRISDWSSDVCSSDLGVGIAEHLHVAAERNEAEFPACARPVVPAEDLRPEADGEHLDADVVPARDQVVAEFVDEHQGGEHGQERQAEAVKTSKKIHALQRSPTVIHPDLPERAALFGKSGRLDTPHQLPPARTGPATPPDDPPEVTVELVPRKALYPTPT